MNNLNLPEAPDGLTWRLSKATYYDGSAELMRIKLGRPHKVIDKVGLFGRRIVEKEVFITVIEDRFVDIKSRDGQTLEERIAKEAAQMVWHYNLEKKHAKDLALSELLCGDYY